VAADLSRSPLTILNKVAETARPGGKNTLLPEKWRFLLVPGLA
jgi:hypothetical protein